MIFCDKKEAFEWAVNTNHPKIFKLKGGAGAANVKLVKRKMKQRSSSIKLLGEAFLSLIRVGAFKEHLRKVKEGQQGLIGLLKGFARLFMTTDFDKQQPPEKGYIYFQDFIPNNDSDARVIVIGDKAFAIKRMVRSNDFRASGSGLIIYDNKEIDEKCIEISFDICRKLKAQSIAFDFVFDKNNQPKIVEISYGYAVEAYNQCPGYWDCKLNWYEGCFNPQQWMVESQIKEFSRLS